MNMQQYGVCANGLTPQGEQTPPIRIQQETPRAAAETDLLWKERKPIKVHFLNGDAKFHDAVREFAPEWCCEADLSLNFEPGGTPDITINFAPIRGYYGIYNSFLGQASRGRVPSMNLIFPPHTSSRVVLKRYILHEFGHALGLIHEHQSPGVDFSWNEKEVIEWFDRHVGWDEEMVRRQVLTPYVTSSTSNTRFDPKSIMLYPIYPGWASSGVVTTWNDDLSETDRSFIANLYHRC
jgi:hypothetical protein